MSFSLRLSRKVKLIIAAAIVAPLLLLALYTWSALTYSYSSGIRAGYAQRFSRTGWLCKTWEGELSMVPVPGAIPGNSPSPSATTTSRTTSTS